MIRSSIRFEMPRSLDDALQILADSGPDGRVLGGGSILVSAMSAGWESPKVVIDPVRLDLNRIDEDGHSVTFGARATYAALLRSETIRTRVPLLHAMVGEVTGGPGLWNLATVGGSCCYANPASDAPACLMALRAQFHLQSIRGKRVVSAADFFRGAFVTDRAPDEMLTHIQVPCETVIAVAYSKLKHSASSWPMVTGACQRSFSDGKEHVSLGVGGLAARPVFAAWTLDVPFDEKDAEFLASEALAQVSVGWTDELADGSYRMKAAKPVTVRVLKRILEGNPWKQK
ncbi:carbon-monoxide dehydrogenase medium subunit [Rhizobium sp. NFR07]|uniref:FAD binding domain-containing protein n=1 Tax=Rhizobium sp. NFR07 TaxID=1566262 RepID=UPI0008EE2BF7|nr:carbon-monoxide dehydrogenase medium subunit [Rhizobium sp. NFR07]